MLPSPSNKYHFAQALFEEAFCPLKSGALTNSRVFQKGPATRLYFPLQQICTFFFFLVLPVSCYQPISLQPHAHMLSHVIPWTSARQTPLSVDFSRQEYWSGLPFPSPQICTLSTKICSYQLKV